MNLVEKYYILLTGDDETILDSLSVEYNDNVKAQRMAQYEYAALYLRLKLMQIGFTVEYYISTTNPTREFVVKVPECLVKKYYKCMGAFTEKGYIKHWVAETYYNNFQENFTNHILQMAKHIAFQFFEDKQLRNIKKADVFVDACLQNMPIYFRRVVSYLEHSDILFQDKHLDTAKALDILEHLVAHYLLHDIPSFLYPWENEKC